MEARLLASLQPDLGMAHFMFTTTSPVFVESSQFSVKMSMKNLVLETVFSQISMFVCLCRARVLYVDITHCRFP